ncbi:helix-turn-helix domain-containing protein [Enterococcus casseliflavus]|uniref:AraC family transcriptional regulator n=1 Tax=Enterococcus casseliflavus TaxID=37734 RepID=UPI00232EBF17|nr:helix-turn-helix domain-containing protein [Enterococcus casseliflavus]MDB1710501.1 helix-turn-helix domain-containing protein [Enterococcus casseliflavus]
MFLIGSALIVGFSGVIYHRTYQNIQETFLQSQHNLVNQVKENLDQKIQMVEYAFSTYSSTQSFSDTMEQPFSVTNYRQVREINSQLAYIGVMGIENASYQLVNLNQHWKIEEGSLKQIDDTEFAAFQALIDNQRYLYWLPEDGYLKMVMTLPVFRQETTALGIAEIQDHTIAQLVADHDDSFLNIFHADGQLLFDNGEVIDSDLHETMIAAAHDDGIFTDKENNKYVVTQSDYNQWYHVIRLAPASVSQAIRELRSGLIVIGSLLIILFLLVSYRIAIVATSPINRIGELLKPKKQGQKLEVNQLISDIDQVLHQNHDLAVKVEHQKPELESLFLLNLFRGCISEADSHLKLSQFGYEVSETEHYAVLLIQIDDLCGRETATIDIFLLAIENLVSEIIPSNLRFQPIISSQETQGTILKLPESVDQKQVLTYCQKIHQAAKDYLKIKISCGVSQSYDRLVETKLAVDNAKEALHYRMNLGEEVIIFFDDIAAQLDNNAIVQYPREAESTFLDAMRSGDLATIKTSYTEVVREIIHENKNPLTIESALFKLINSIVQLGQLLGADHTSLQNSRKVYQSVLNQTSLFKVEQIIYQELVLPIVETTQAKTDREIRSLSEKMVLIVHQQYDQDLSLDSIAEQLHYNANYLSNVFKKELSINFADYLQNYRLQVAKKWLRETDLTIKEIAANLQYTNSQNFIRFFKKKEQMTPGEYRKRSKD